MERVDVGYWPDGKIYNEYHFFNNKMHGPQKRWSNIGILMRYFFAKNNDAHGIDVCWNGNIGTMDLIQTWKKDTQHGFKVFFNYG
jgi:antitoxin component YwqK of YwqJK toxin-antitoxin module